MRIAVCLAVAALAAASCTKKVVKPVVVPVVDTESPRRLAAADTLVRVGCLDCLRQALREYDVLRRVTLVADQATNGFIRAAVLTSLREQELGLADSGLMAAARAATADLPPDVQTRTTTLLDVVESLPPLGPAVSVRLPPDVDRMRRLLDRRREWQTQVAAEAADDPLAAYLWLTIVCTAVPTPPSPEARRDVLGPLYGALLLTFKDVTACTRGDRATLTALVEGEPRFVELHYYAGLAALGGQTRPGTPMGAPNLDEADAQFRVAYEWQPAWPALTLSMANVALALEDFARAFELYDATLRLVPDQPDAVLGKVRALTYLGRNEDAIATIDTLLRLQRSPGEARYWRALNEAQLSRNDDAWMDIGLAEKLLINIEVPKLAGAIAIARRELPVARVKLEEARARQTQWRIQPPDCDIDFFLQTVVSALEDWPAAHDVSLAAAACFEAEARRLAAENTEVQTKDIPPERKARMVAKGEQQIKTGLRKMTTALFNAAVASFRLARLDEAHAYANRVADDEQFGERARALIEQMKTR